MARYAGRFKLGLKPAQIYVRLSIIPLSQQSIYVSLGIIRHYVVACGLFVLILVVFMLFLLHYVSAKFHLWPSSGYLTATSDRNVESCNRIPSNYCLPIKDNYKFGTDPTMEDQIRRTNNWIYKTKKSNFDHPSGPVAQRVEALSLYGSWWALSEDSGFKSYSSWPEVYLVKNVVRLTTMEGSNYWDYGYKTQHYYPRSRLNHLKKARGEIWPKPSEEETTQKLPRWGQKVRKK